MQSTYMGSRNRRRKSGGDRSPPFSGLASAAVALAEKLVEAGPVAVSILSLAALGGAVTPVMAPAMLRSAMVAGMVFAPAMLAAAVLVLRTLRVPVLAVAATAAAAASVAMFTVAMFAVPMPGLAMFAAAMTGLAPAAGRKLRRPRG